MSASTDILEIVNSYLTSMSLTPEQFHTTFMYDKDAYTTKINNKVYTFIEKGSSRLFNLYIKEGEESDETPLILVKFLDFKD